MDDQPDPIDRVNFALALLEHAKTRHDDKLKELEERIRQLEARPCPIVPTWPVPTWPPLINPPYYPYWPTWYASNGTAWG